VDWQLAPVPQVEKPRQTGERRFGDRALNVEKENGFRGGRPLFGQAEPNGLTHPLGAMPNAVPDEIDVGIFAPAVTDRRSSSATA
jgi:hypothetical protein